ncbi:MULTISPECIES: hypothetical protein [unclassified Pseudomonas]|uniref:hypothetical protein n=1 Tax=unclassified Pseudomonas TaxID=196821 RepID=UPI00131E1782|nr:MULTISPECIES: hypothetical protein [unclassified Pseudomonas]
MSPSRPIHWYRARSTLEIVALGLGVIALVIAVDQGLRNSPSEHLADYHACKGDGGLARMNAIGEIVCRLPSPVIGQVAAKTLAVSGL